MAKGRKTGGRTAGVPNKATADIKALAGKFSEEAFNVLMSIARKSESDAARVSAVKEIFDRAYGRPAQAVTGDPDAPLKVIQEIIWGGLKDKGS